MLLQSIIRFDIERKISRLFTAHMPQLKLLFILFFINIAIFGQKLFFEAYPADDYMRFWGDDNSAMLITNSARWGQALLNDYVFVGRLQILPYLHGLIGIFCFTLMGYLSARYLERERPFEIGIITLLITATPPVAHNLFFSTNITTWLTLLLGLIGFLMLQGNWWKKIVGFLFLLFSIANYQTIIQIVLMLLIFKSLLHILQDRAPIKTIFLQAIITVALVGAAYGVSFWINELFIQHYHLHETHRLAKAHHAMNWDTILHHIRRLFTTPIELHYFNRELHALYLIMLVFSAAMIFVKALRTRHDTPRCYIARLILTLLALGALLPVLNLPILVVDWIPTRAHLPLGWLLGGIVAIFFAFFDGIIKTVGLVLAFAVMILNIYYITLFFDACHRQTEADIRRANMVVERIRTHPNYNKEPMAFYIEGTQRFHIKGWYMRFQDPFDSYWAKYKFFRYFTDFKFTKATRAQRNKIVEYLYRQGKRVQAYPFKDSVIVYDNIALLVLNPAKLNILITKNELLKRLPLSKEPTVKSRFDLFLDDNVLYYYKSPCTKGDVKNKFFLRIYPKDPKNTYVNGRQINPFQTWDFHFWLHGKIENGVCKAAVRLPNYPIAKIRTGQFGQANGPLLWDVTIPVP